MSKKSATAFTIAAFLALPLAACDEAPTALSPSESGTASIQLASSSDVATASLLGLFRLDGAAAGNVSLDQVSSIDVTLQTVEVLRLEEEGARWVSLDVEDQELNLLDLPEDGIEVARGELEAGDYCNVRFFLGDETITFSEDVTLGGGPAATTFAADEPHDLFIPSEDQTGLKVPTVRFSVDEEQENVTIAFDAGESVQTVNVTGRGVLMTPVLTPEEGTDDLPECEGVEDEGDNGENGDENGENGADNGDNGSNGSE